jgi:hypothetical protein
MILPFIGAEAKPGNRNKSISLNNFYFFVGLRFILIACDFSSTSFGSLWEF